MAGENLTELKRSEATASSEGGRAVYRPPMRQAHHPPTQQSGRVCRSTHGAPPMQRPQYPPAQQGGRGRRPAPIQNPQYPPAQQGGRGWRPAPMQNPQYPPAQQDDRGRRPAPMQNPQYPPAQQDGRPAPQAAISYQTPGASSSSLTQKFEQLSLAPRQPATSSRLIKFPLRPGKGKRGMKCLVRANHFLVELPYRDLHQYDVSIIPEASSPTLNRAVMSELIKLYRLSHLGNRLPAYDGRRSLYTAGRLPFATKEFAITLVDEDSDTGGIRREREFRVVFKLAASVSLHNLALFLQGNQAETPQEALQVLDIVLRELPNINYTPVGRSFYSSDLLGRNRIGYGVESWRGFYQSIRPTQMGLTLNIDVSSTAFIEPLPVVEFVSQLLDRDVTQRRFSSFEFAKVKKTLKTVKVEITHRGKIRRKYRICGLTSLLPRELTFVVNGMGTRKSVFQHFQETYGYIIQHVNLPCLQVGNPQKPEYLPMEVCKIVDGQRYSKRLNERQINGLLKSTCQRPQQRELDILRTIRHNDYSSDANAKEFGIYVSNNLATVDARVLPPPRLKYHDAGKEKDCVPHIGQWNMVDKKLLNGGTVNHWICINFSSAKNTVASVFCHELARMCQNSGMTFNLNPVLPPYQAHPNDVERAIKTVYVDAMTRIQGGELDLLIAILPDNNNNQTYGELKRICETDIGLLSQCCLFKHVFKMNKQCLANLALKINVKVGGRNTVLTDALSKRIPIVSDEPTIIFGADVSHPHPGEDSSPSIAAVVASQDWPEITKYLGLVSAQSHRQELVQDLYKEWDDPQRGLMKGGMVKDLLYTFYESSGMKPSRIIFYRDGVSDGQFHQVLLHELEAIRKACSALNENYQPRVTFVVVQKRHHTRLFPYNHSALHTVDKTGNILPGTVVDSKICHPTEFDFFLCSHAGVQGTSRPAHYHVLWDENCFTADGMQMLTNDLCYTYARCTRSVSIVPPAYYAHLAAFRARFYMESDTSDGGPSTNGAVAHHGPYTGASSNTHATRNQGGNARVRALPAIKENVKRVMFYC